MDEKSASTFGVEVNFDQREVEVYIEHVGNVHAREQINNNHI